MGSKINKEITVSVVIVNYNNFELLDNCLSSLFKYNNGEKLEVIVIDNNSTEVNIEQFEQRYPIKLIMNSRNKGFAVANNIGLKYASGKYVLFLNNDVEFIENSIDKIIDFTELKSEPLFIGCQLLNVDNTLQESVSDFPTLANILGENFFLHKLLPHSNTLNKYHKNLFNGDSPVEVDVIKGAFMFCERKALEQLNGFDTKFFFYSEEVDLCYRFKKNKGKIYFYPGTSIIHYENSNKNKDCLPGKLRL
jgi:GT2 family glycosyltransferase